MKTKNAPVISIVGRTNVGKSTIYNAIAGKRLAIVEDYPGVTRDRCEVLITRHGRPFTLVDTGGLIGEEEPGLRNAIRTQASVAIAQSDLVICVFDGIAGPHPCDAEVVNDLRCSGKPVLWVVNKCEKPLVEESAAEFYSLGIGDYLTISAAHNKGIRELISLIKEKCSTCSPELSAESDEETIKIAILGKPNVGKSTLVNRFLGEDRLVTSEMAGTTRDAVEISLVRDGQRYLLVDTAGLRKKAKVEEGSLERFSNLRTLRALAQADVALLLIDATTGHPTEQDVKIASLAHERGVPLVIVVNKWDAVEKDHRSAKLFEEEARNALRFVPYAPFAFVSALSGKRCPKLFSVANDVYRESRKRIKTAGLNSLLTRAFEMKPPPIYRGEPVKLFFTTQVAVAPPTFVIFVNQAKGIPLTYQRYLKSVIRKEYCFSGSNIKLHVRRRRSSTEKGQVANL